MHFCTNQICSNVHLPQVTIVDVVPISFHVTFVRDKPKLKKSRSEAALHKQVFMATANSIDEVELVMDHVERVASPNYFQMAGNTAIAGAKRASIPIKR